MSLESKLPKQIVKLSEKVEKRIGQPVLAIKRYVANGAECTGFGAFSPVMATDLSLGIVQASDVEYDGRTIVLPTGKFTCKTFHQDRTQLENYFLKGWGEGDTDNLTVQVSEYLHEYNGILPHPLRHQRDRGKGFAVTKILVGYHEMIPFFQVVEPYVWTIMKEAIKAGFVGDKHVKNYLESREDGSTEYDFWVKSSSSVPISDIPDLETGLKRLDTELAKEIRRMYLE